MVDTNSRYCLTDSDVAVGSYHCDSAVPAHHLVVFRIIGIDHAAASAKEVVAILSARL